MAVVDARSLAAWLEVISDGAIEITGRLVAECRYFLEGEIAWKGGWPKTCRDSSFTR